MGFSFGKIAPIAGTIGGGILGNMLLPGAGAFIGAGAGGMLGNLFNKQDPTTVTQGPLETPEQAIARRELLKFATTGSYGGYTAGQGYTGSLGNFAPTGQEALGLGKLNDLLLAGHPDIFNAGVSNLNELLSPTSRFDPYSTTGEFSPFLAASNREFGLATDQLKRNLSMQGNLFSTDTARQFKDLTAQHGESINSKLASLYSDYINRKTAAIPVALQAGQDQQNLDLGLVGASQQYGGLSRLLGNQEAQAQYQEFLRKRNELLNPINSLATVAGSNVPFGASSVTLPGGPNPFDNVLNLLAQFGGQYLGAKGGGTPPPPSGFPQGYTRPSANPLDFGYSPFYTGTRR